MNYLKRVFLLSVLGFSLSILPVGAMPEDQTHDITYEIKNVDVKVAGTTIIDVTANDAKKFYPTEIIVRSSITGLTNWPTFSIGTNSPNFNNLVVSTQPAIGNKDVEFFPYAAGAGAVPSNTPMVLNVTSTATATAFSLSILMRGVTF